MVKSLFNSLSPPKECSNLQSTNELVLLIISLANPVLKSKVNLKTVQNEKQEGQHLTTSTPRNNIIYCYIMSVKKLSTKL